jgi:flagellar FliJ protein
MAYRFRLDPVLRHRRRLEDLRAQDLARAHQSLEAVREQFTALASEAIASRHALGDAAERGIAAAELSQMARDIEILHAESARCAARVSAEGERVDAAREELIKAAQGRQILERLEASARAAHGRRIEQLEQQQTDQVAASGHLWRRQQSESDGEDMA